jgi:alcohol dehydrogenase class IV
MSQKILFGFGAYKKLNDILKKLTPRRTLLITGKESFTSSGAEKLLGEIINKYDCVRFCDFAINTRLEDIKNGVDLLNETQSDLIMGVGGGSVIDLAKAAAILATQAGSIKEIIKNGTALQARKVPIVIIPTTAGTGSESTHFSTVYIGKKKHSLAHYSMIPDYAIVDPTFTMNLPAYLTACTGMDAMCQAIESHWSVNSTGQSRLYSRQALILALSNIVKAVNSPNRISRENMCRASNLAGRAINIAETTAAHSLSYPMTSYYNLPHGHAVSLTLPYFVEFNYNVSLKNIQDKRGVAFVKNRIDEMLEALEVKTPKEAREKIIDIMKAIGLETRLSKLGIYNGGIEIIRKNAYNPQRMKNNPRAVKDDDVACLLEKIK